MRIKTSAVLAVAFLGMVAGSARAQETVVAKVPFPFVVRGSELPAGRYEITNDNGILSIRGLDHRGSVYAIVMPADGHDPAGSEPALVFVRHENEYHLSGIWESDEDGLAVSEGSVKPLRGSHEGQPQSSVVVTSGIDVIGR